MIYEEKEGTVNVPDDGVRGTDLVRVKLSVFCTAWAISPMAAGSR